MWKNCIVAIIMMMPCYVLAQQTCQTEGIPASTPTAQFSIHEEEGAEDGTATDMRTGLMWKRCLEGEAGELWDSSCGGSAGLFTWAEALQRADISEFAGYSDWRLPNLKELYSIVEEQCVVPAINTSVFPLDPGLNVWSASAKASDPKSAWYVYFGYGYSSSYHRSNTGGVRLVRSVQ